MRPRRRRPGPRVRFLSPGHAPPAPASSRARARRASRPLPRRAEFGAYVASKAGDSGQANGKNRFIADPSGSLRALCSLERGWWDRAKFGWGGQYW